MLIQVNDLKIWFGSDSKPFKAVDGISFSIDRGETYCLVGESGSGKSISSLSLMQLVTQQSHTSGEVLFDYHKDESTSKIDLMTLSESSKPMIRGSRIAMIFQEPMTSLNPVFTVGKQIDETLRCQQKVSNKEARLLAIEALREVQIPDPEGCYDRYPNELSGGMRQRVMIAMALIGKPDLLIADEPTTALDVTTQARILELMQKLQKERNMAMLFVTHDFGVVNLIADKVAVMKDGEIVESGSRQEVLYNPQHEYTQKLIAALPSKLVKPETKQNGTSKDLLTIKKLEVYYPIRQGLFKRTVGHVKAVDGVDLNIKQGSIMALIGESGSGKTTLGRALVQLIKKTGGDIHFDGQDLAALSDRQMRAYRKQIQFIFQDPFASLNPKMLIGDIILEGMEALSIGKNRDDRLKRIEKVLEEVHMPIETMQRYPHEFSGGQRQRVGIARCLAVEPSFIVCDEITSALDVSIQASILTLLLELKEKRDLTMLFITHNMEVVEYLADEVAVMYRGKLVECGPVDKVCKDPDHDYTKKLLAAVPRM
jgi:peptide/nickel transport system ATP-binding protein